MLASTKKGLSRLSPYLPARAKHTGKMLLLPHYRHRYQEWQRLRSTPRYTRCTTPLLGHDLELLDAASFCSMYEEIFNRQIYKFKSSSDSPHIIDGGANIGMSVIFFKQLYPSSQIIAFEPDNQVFATLQQNVHSFRLDNVTLINKALWSSDTSLDFMAEGADAGRATNLDAAYAVNRVEATALAGFLGQPIDFLKLDIEGAETEVLSACRCLLHNVANIFVEYHSFAGQPQTLPHLLEILSYAGFRLHIHPMIISNQPLQDCQTYHGMDMQLNIFGFRR